MGVSILNIYVGNIAWGMTEDDLEAIFAEYGSVTSANIIADKYSGRSRGFGFVEMEDDAAAEAAIEALNETEQSGRALKVNQAKPRESRD
jgi:RNA recognition motif-containing protein